MTKKENPEIKEETISEENCADENGVNQSSDIKEEIKRNSKKHKKDNTNDKIEELVEALSLKNDQLLRLHAEFDNYRKRTLKEKMELTKTAGESILLNILPVLDDFERALKSIDSATEIEPVKEGIALIYKRLGDFIKSNGITEIDALEKELDTDLHEAITKIPSPNNELKGKIIDVVQKGYLLNDKVIRFAKVVIGE